MLSITARLTLVACLLAGLFAFTPVLPAHAASIVVNTNSDDDLAGEPCSLREAIIAANTNAAYNGCPAGDPDAVGSDTITFAADYTITVRSQLPDITSDITITGLGRNNTIIQANANPGVATYRIFKLSGSSNNISLNSLTVRNGRCVEAGTCSSPTLVGGAIYVESAHLDINDVLFSGNKTDHYAGAISIHLGSLNISNSTFLQNTARNTGGAIYADQTSLVITNTTFSNNISENYSERGGAIYVSNSTVTTTGCAFTSNTAANGGAFYNVNSTTLISDSIFSGNQASPTLPPPGSYTGSGGAIYRFSGSIQIAGSEFTGNIATAASNNFGGGAIYSSDTAGSLEITDSSFASNQGYHGGAVYNRGTSATIRTSTFSENIATQLGGVIYNSGTLTVVNDTLSANQASSGGGLYNAPTGTLNIYYSTLSGNQVTYNGGALLNAGTLNLANTILANSILSGGAPVADCYNNAGTIASNLGSLVELDASSTYACGYAVTGDPLLGALTDNGGSTDTMALQPGSPAIDQGNAGTCEATDQRGVLRPQGIDCDMGAFEREQFKISGNAGTDAATITYTGGSTISDVTGYYQFYVISGWTGDVTPSKLGCDFDPVFRSYSNLQADAANEDYTVSGCYTLMLKSQAGYDGWILESGENSTTGGTLNSLGTVFKLGDAAADKQYRAILSFNTNGLPDAAQITSLKLKVRKNGISGSNPFYALGSLKLDVRTGPFGSSANLQLADFQAAASLMPAGTFNETPVSMWYTATLGSAVYPFINTAGITQFRLRFSLADNDDGAADFIKFYSGNAEDANRPVLIIEYYIP